VTTAPAPKPMSLDALLSRSWALFKRNWTVALPPFIAAAAIIAVLIVLVIVCVTAAIAHGNPDRWSGGFIAMLVGAYLLFVAFVLLASLWAGVAMFGMADAAWERGTTTLGDGLVAFGARAGAAFVAGIGIFGLAIAALILFLPTLGLSLLALPFVTMYVFPSVVTGGRGGFEAIAESFRLVRHFFGSSALVYLVLYAIQYGISLVMIVAIVPLEFATIPMGSDSGIRMPSIPLVGFSGALYLATMVALIAYNGFHTLALVGMYRDLMAQPAPQALSPAGGTIVQP
jgi:hypothetical protein